MTIVDSVYVRMGLYPPLLVLVFIWNIPCGNGACCNSLCEFICVFLSLYLEGFGYLLSSICPVSCYLIIHRIPKTLCWHGDLLETCQLILSVLRTPACSLLSSYVSLYLFQFPSRGSFSHDDSSRHWWVVKAEYLQGSFNCMFC